MPSNRVIYAGLMLVIASALVWAGAELTKRIEWLLPYSMVAGIVLLVVGAAMEYRQRRKSPSEPR